MIVHACHYQYDKRPTLYCTKGEGYDEYVNGVRLMDRDYVMSKPNDKIDVFVYVDDFYETYCE